MRCAEFESRLQDVLDERGQPELDPALAAHFEHCADCAAKLAVYETMWEGLTLSAPRLSEEFSARLSHSVLERHSESRHADEAQVELAPRRRALAAGAMVAIAAVLLVGLVSLLRPDPNIAKAPAPQPVAPAAPTAVVKVEQPERAVQIDTLPPIDNPLASLPVTLRRQPMADVAKETGQSLAVAFLAIPGVGSGDLASRPAWMSDVSDGLAPVTDSMTGALNVLLRAIPSTGPAVRDPSAS